MPKDTFAQDDPFELVGMVLPGEQDAEAVALMGRGFIEEFVQMGWDATQTLLLFRDPFYRGPHAVYRARGEGFVRQLLSQVQEEWSANRHN
ncbi:MAG: hypothetical protein HYZ81_13945 [Nitrospinae bacterium]|nr:hypothetical protein [Nitrospinota bacterium]